MKLLFTNTSICLFLLTFLTVNVIAQKKSDYVITASGDSLSCTISESFFSSVLPKYKTADMSKAVRVDPLLIKEYSTNNGKHIYASAYMPNAKEPRFSEVLEKGKIYLYEIINEYQSGGFGTAPTYNSTKNWFVSKGSDKMQSLKTSSFFFLDKSRNDRKDDFGEMLKDNRTVYDKYQTDKKFSFKELRKLIHLYNSGIQIEDND
jgi:hypothetical protein